MALRGWGDALVEGLQAADQSLESRARRKEADVRTKAAEAELGDKNRQRETEESRRNTLTEVSTNTELTPFQLYEEAAKRRRDAGDMDGYEEFSKRSAAARAQWLSQSLADAYRRNDMGAGLKLLNDGFPDGIQYDLEQSQDGSIVAVARRGETEIGRNKFGSSDEFWAHVQKRAQPGDIYARLRQQQLDAKELELKDSQISENKASTEAKTQQGLGFKIGNELTSKFGPQYEQGRVNLVRAQAGAAAANAEESRAGAGVKNAQRKSIENGTGMDGTGPRGAGIGSNKLIEELVSAYVDPVKRSTLSPEQLNMAEEALRASGTSVMRVPPRGGAIPGQAAPGVPAQKDYSSLWK